MITKCFILYYSIDFKAHLNLHSQYFTLMILNLWNGPLTGLSSISNLSLCVSVGANTANHHWLYNNFHQSLSFEYHPRLQLYREHQTHFFQFYSLHSHMTPVSTESFFLLRYLQKMKSTRAAKKKGLLEDAQLQCFSKIRVQTQNGTLLMAPHAVRTTGVPQEKKKNIHLSGP